MHNKLEVIIFCTLIFVGCQNNKDKKDSHHNLSISVKSKEKENKTLVIDGDENFDIFFKKFESERNFQLSRIVFPLKLNPDKSEEQYNSVLTSNQWKFTNFTKIKNIQIKKVNESKDKIDIMISIIDTGTQVIYHFKIKNREWWLYAITDQSD